jgi:hypothetical protein
MSGCRCIGAKFGYVCIECLDRVVDIVDGLVDAAIDDGQSGTALWFRLNNNKTIKVEERHYGEGAC